MTKEEKEWVNLHTRGSGMTRTISMSNTIKIMPSRKNRKEKGIRAEFLGSNPHSNGAVFSRSEKVRDLRIQAVANVRVVIAEALIKVHTSKVMDRKY